MGVFSRAKLFFLLNSEYFETVYSVAQTSQTVALLKAAEGEEVRPIGLQHPLIKVLNREVVAANRLALQRYLEPQQLILSPGGAAKLVFTVRAVLEERRDFVCFSVDTKNAFNSMARAACLETLESVESLRHLTQFFGVTMAPSTVLESGGKVWGEAPEGETQGSPRAMGSFAVTLQPSLLQLDADVWIGEGLALAGADDVFVMGPPELVVPAVEKFQREVYESAGWS